MTFQQVKEIIENNHIPEDVHFLSDSGWECSATEMDGMWYCEELNTIVFTQGAVLEEPYQMSDWESGLRDTHLWVPLTPYTKETLYKWVDAFPERAERYQQILSVLDPLPEDRIKAIDAKIEPLY